MMVRTLSTASVLALVACGPGGRGGGSGSADHLEISPATASVTVTNGVAVNEIYTATYNGSDVTAETTFSIADPGYGTWTGATLSVSGTAVGPTAITAAYDPAAGSAGSASPVIGGADLTVYAKGFRASGSNVPANASDLFANATESAALAPTIAYPANNVIVPPNIGELDVHWTAPAGDDLFALTMSNEYITWTVFTEAANPSADFFTLQEWGALASSRAPLSLTVAGLAVAAPATKGTSTAQTASATNELVQGGVYYWQNEPTQGVYRYDMSTPSIPPSSFFPTGQQPESCIGCHALSRDGTKIALTLTSGNGPGTVIDVSNYNVLVPYTTNTQYWNFGTFTPDSSELVTVFEGAMSLRQSNGGTVIATVPSSAGMEADHPDLSPDGTKLANVETINDTYDFQVSQGAIVVRSFDQTTNTFGAIQQLVPNVTGASNYYPSFSPDNQWILFTRTTGNSYADPSAEVWVVKADGSKPPIQLMTADTTGASLMNSWARWAPFQQTYGSNSEALFYITFSSVRPYGVIPLTPGEDGPDPQIWMAPFFPDRAEAGMDPSGAAFRMPFQLLTAANHIAQWTQAVVIGRKADGTPLTQAEAVAQGLTTNR
jgi:hypothetical protein